MLQNVNQDIKLLILETAQHLKKIHKIDFPKLLLPQRPFCNLVYLYDLSRILVYKAFPLLSYKGLCLTYVFHALIVLCHCFPPFNSI